MLLNSLGDAETRQKYTIALQAYLGERKGSLSELSRLRLERGAVLRILDSKEAEDQAVLASAPLIHDFFTPSARDRFLAVQGDLSALGVEFVHAPKLVRGLDYYSHTIFEFEISLKEGPAAVLAGGRYDGLSVQLGGKPFGAIGWAAGIERLCLLLDEGSVVSQPVVAVAIAPSEPDEAAAVRSRALQLARTLRDGGVRTVMLAPAGLGKQFASVCPSSMRELYESLLFAGG